MGVYSQSEMMLKRPNDVLLVVMVLVYSQSAFLAVLVAVLVVVYGQSEVLQKRISRPWMLLSVACWTKQGMVLTSENWSARHKRLHRWLTSSARQQEQKLTPP